MEATSELIVDDHALVRVTLSERLEREPGITVAGVAPDADVAVESARELNPDIILMDIDMPGRSRFDAARTIRSLLPDTCFVFLSAYAYDRYIEQALDVGAMAYLTKGEPPEEVIRTIQSVITGRSCFSPEVGERIILDGGRARLASKGSRRTSSLTEREFEVLRYLSLGLAKKDISRLMHVSVKTVDKHTSNLMDKLDIHDRVELARFAIREGLTGP